MLLPGAVVIDEGEAPPVRGQARRQRVIGDAGAAYERHDRADVDQIEIDDSWIDGMLLRMVYRQMRRLPLQRLARGAIMAQWMRMMMAVRPMMMVMAVAVVMMMVVMIVVHG